MKTSNPLFFLMILCLVACSDEGNEPGPDETSERMFENCRVTKSERENFSASVYTYEEQGRLKTYTRGESYAAEYTYGINVTTVKTYSYGDLATTLTVTTDENGFPLNYEKVHANGILKTETVTYQYDAKNQLVRIVKTTEGSTTEKHTVFQWHEGNMVAESEPDGTKMTKYTYGQEINQPADWFGEIGVDYGLRAIRNKNRLKTITDPDGDVFSHSYNEDDNGRIKSETITTPDITYTKHYTYECN